MAVSLRSGGGAVRGPPAQVQVPCGELLGCQGQPLDVEVPVCNATACACRALFPDRRRLERGRPDHAGHFGAGAGRTRVHASRRPQVQFRLEGRGGRILSAQPVLVPAHGRAASHRVGADTRPSRRSGCGTCFRVRVQGERNRARQFPGSLRRRAFRPQPQSGVPCLAAVRPHAAGGVHECPW